MWVDSLKQVGGTFETVGNGSLNDAGQVAFSGSYDRTSAIFLGTDEEIHTVARSGDPAPGGGTFSLRLPFPRLKAGNLTFSSNLSTGETGVFVAELK